jgi:hypothetical protein
VSAAISDISGGKGGTAKVTEVFWLMSTMDGKTDGTGIDDPTGDWWTFRRSEIDKSTIMGTIATAKKQKTTRVGGRESASFIQEKNGDIQAVVGHFIGPGRDK